MRMRYAPLALVVICGTLFCQVLSFQFLNWDDMRHLARLGSLGEIWSAPYFNFYIPVTYTVWDLLAAVFGQKAWAFHTLNLAVHTANSVLVFLLISRMTSLRGAFLGAVLFAVHPLQIESVAWVSGFRDLLGTALALAAFYYYRPKYALSVALFAFSLLAKPLAVMLPLLLLGTERKTTWKRLTPFFILALASALLTLQLQDAKDMDFIPPLWSRPLLALDAAGFYVRHFIFPFPLLPDYSRTPRNLIASGEIFYNWNYLFLLAFTALAWFFAPKRSWLNLVLLSILPTLGLVPFRFQDISTVADHYMYLPMVFLGLGLARIYTSAPIWFQKGLTVWLMALAAVDLYQIPFWRNSETLAAHVLTLNPKSFAFNNCMGDSLAHAGKYAEAVPFYEASLALSPKLLETKINLSWCWFALGKRSEAIHLLSEVHREDPEPTFVTVNLATMLLGTAQFAETARLLEETLPHDPLAKGLHLKLALAYQGLGRREEALHAAQAELAIDPQQAEALALVKSLHVK